MAIHFRDSLVITLNTPNRIPNRPGNTSNIKLIILSNEVESPEWVDSNRVKSRNTPMENKNNMMDFVP